MLAGILPDRPPPDRIWGGGGNGLQCVVCGASVTRDQTGLEIEFTARDGAGTGNYHMHVACYSALEFERYQLWTARDA